MTRMTKLVVVTVAALAATAGVIGNIDKLAAFGRDRIVPWLDPGVSLDVHFAGVPGTELLVFVQSPGEKVRVVATARIASGEKHSFKLFGNRRYVIGWQGAGYRAAESLAVTATPPSAQAV